VPLLGATAGPPALCWRSVKKRSDGCYFSIIISVEDPDTLVQKFVSEFKAKYQHIPTSGRPVPMTPAHILL